MAVFAPRYSAMLRLCSEMYIAGLAALDSPGHEAVGLLYTGKEDDPAYEI